MNAKKLIFYGLAVLIIILIIFNMRIIYLKDSLKKDCAKTYDINGSCFCPHHKARGNVTYNLSNGGLYYNDSLDYSNPFSGTYK